MAADGPSRPRCWLEAAMLAYPPQTWPRLARGFLCRAQKRRNPPHLGDAGCRNPWQDAAIGLGF